MNMVLRNLVAPFGCPRAYYLSSCRFSNAVEALGVETIGVECLSFERPGFRLQLCSGENEYEVLLERDRVKLTLIRLDQQRVPLAEGGAANQSVWDRFLQVVRQLEDK